MLYGIKPVVVSVILSALWGMLKPRRKNYVGVGIMAAVWVAYLLGVGPLILLLAGGLVMWGIKAWPSSDVWPGLGLIWLFFTGGQFQETVRATAFNLPRLFWVFFKAGAVMFGSGYVLLAFIHEDLVIRLGWLTEAQLVDAIAIGQVTPGPLSTTATFVGYLMGGVPAAVVATFAMFLPSFIFVGIVFFCGQAAARI
jgi:chromate transporter